MSQRNELDEYLDFRHQIIRGNLKILRQELIHVLYKLYQKQFRTIVSAIDKHGYTRTYKENIEKLFLLQKDFSETEQYVKEINYQEPIFKNIPDLDSLPKDQEVCKIQTYNYIIYVSQYTYEVLYSLTEKNHYKTIESLFFVKPRDSHPHLVVVKNLTDEGYLGVSCQHTKHDATDIDKINGIPYQSGLQREDFLYYSKLDDIYKRKVSKNLLPGTENLTIKPFPTVQETKRYQLEKMQNNFVNNAPDVKMKFRIEHAKDYQDKAYIDEENEPHIQKLNLSDPGGKISCVKISTQFKILAVGCMSGKIKAYYLTEKCQDDNEEGIVEDNQKMTTNEELLKAKPEDFEYDMQSVTLIGHSGPITCFDLNYDDKYLLSGSVDCTIRLWDLQLGTCMAEYKAHVRTIWCLEFCPRGFHFASGGAENVIFVWATNKQFPLLNLIGHINDVTQVRFTQNLSYLCSCSMDKTFRIWNLDDGSLVRILFFDEVQSW